MKCYADSPSGIDISISYCANRYITANLREHECRFKSCRKCDFGKNSAYRELKVQEEVRKITDKKYKYEKVRKG